MKNAISFNLTTLNNLPILPQQYEVRDTKTPGLILRVNPGGSKTFMLYRRVEGRLMRMKIGRLSDITIEAARNKAQFLNGQIVTGIRPHEIVKEKRRELTFAELFDKYYREHSLLRNKRPQDNKATVSYHLLPKIGNMKLSDIRRSKMKEIFLQQGKARGEQQANRVLNIARAVFNFAIREELFDGKNPCIGIQRFRTKSRDRFLSSDELRRFFKALEHEEEIFRDFFQILLFTGARKSNVLAMKWHDIDFDLKRWRLDEDESKNNEVNIYILADEALDILKRRHKDNEQSPTSSIFVFPSLGNTGHLIDPKKSFARIKERMEVDDIRIHDLRRTLASYMAINNTSLPIIGRALNHKSQVSTQIYARLSMDPVREAINGASNLIKEKKIYPQTFNGESNTLYYHYNSKFVVSYK